MLTIPDLLVIGGGVLAALGAIAALVDTRTTWLDDDGDEQ